MERPFRITKREGNEIVASVDITAAQLDWIITATEEKLVELAKNILTPLPEITQGEMFAASVSLKTIRSIS